MSSRLLPQKRSQPDSTPQFSLSPEECKIYEIIRSRKNMGIWVAELKKETGLPPQKADKAIKNLLGNKLIKDVVNIHNKGRKTFMAAEFEPSKEISGGAWYSSKGILDTEFIAILRQLCLKHIENRKVATIETIQKFIVDSQVSNEQCTMQQIMEIVGMMVLDKEVEEFKSTGLGDFSEVPAGKICYRKARGAKESIFSLIPCGVCPRISECTPDGIISPKTCVYYNKWLGLEF